MNESSIFEFVIRRSNVLEDALRRMQKSSFDPLKKLHVKLCIDTYLHAAYLVNFAGGVCW